MPQPAATIHAAMDRWQSTHPRGKKTELAALRTPRAARKSRFNVCRRVLPHTSNSR